MYKLDFDADINMTMLKGAFTSTFPQMLKVFGKGLEGDYKISMEWVFTDDNNNVFTVYDWKSTNLYDRDYLSPESLWSSDEQYRFHVGGRGAADEFIDWITKRLEDSSGVDND